MQELLKNDADVNGKDSFGWTALQNASSKGMVEVVRELLTHGADVHEVAPVILFHGLDENVIKASPRRAIDVAYSGSLDHPEDKRYEKIVQLLQSAGRKKHEIDESQLINRKVLSRNDLCHILYFSDKKKRDNAFKLLFFDVDWGGSSCQHLEKRYKENAMYKYWVVSSSWESQQSGILKENNCLPEETEQPYYYGALDGSREG